MLNDHNYIKKKSKINVNETLNISGGTSNANSKKSDSNLRKILANSGTPIGVSIDDTCHKGDTFKPLYEDTKQTNKCRDCWYLKFSNGFYCDCCNENK